MPLSPEEKALATSPGWGEKCPQCGAVDTDWLATTNEWRNYCRHCDIRYNDAGEILGR